MTTNNIVQKIKENTGYPIDWFITTPPDFVICSVCKEVAYRPPNLTCGHVCCSSCIDASGFYRRCPTCRADIQSNLVEMTFLKRMIENLPIKCPFAINAVTKATCEWTGSLGMNEGELDKHLQSCSNGGIIQCPDACLQYLPSNDLEHHRQFECKQRMVNCTHCHESMKAWFEPVHKILNTNRSHCYRMDRCVYLECKAQIPVTDDGLHVNRHLKTECSKFRMICTLCKPTSHVIPLCEFAAHLKDKVIFSAADVSRAMIQQAWSYYLTFTATVNMNLCLRRMIWLP
jgi:hypothetical protein